MNISMIRWERRDLLIGLGLDMSTSRSTGNRVLTCHWCFGVDVSTGVIQQIGPNVATVARSSFTTVTVQSKLRLNTLAVALQRLSLYHTVVRDAY